MIRAGDVHEQVFEFNYLQWEILEDIRQGNQVQVRARSIYSWCDGTLELAEMHHEIRLEGPGQPLQADA